MASALRTKMKEYFYGAYTFKIWCNIDSIVRMTKLVDDEVEEDDQFWNQEALKEVITLS